MSGNLAMKLEVPQRVALLVVETLLSTDPFNVLTLTDNPTDPMILQCHCIRMCTYV